jgi:CubicO group peptidase (beta-lactamase class C family)
MWHPVMQLDNDPKRGWMGLSFMVWPDPGKRIIGHSGHQAGSLSWLYFNPAKSTAALLAINTDEDELRKETKEAMDAISHTLRELIK